MLYYNIFIYNVYTIECIYYYWLKYVIVPISLYNVRDFVVLNENFLISLFQREIFWFRCFQREFLWFRSFRWFRRNYPISPKSWFQRNHGFQRSAFIDIIIVLILFHSFHVHVILTFSRKMKKFNDKLL